MMCRSLWPILAVLALTLATLPTAFAEDTPGFEMPTLPPLTLPEIVTMAAERHGVDPALLSCLVTRESGWRPYVTSPGNHRGLLQFADRTWAWASINAGHAGASPYDPYAASDVAGHLVAAGGVRHWSTARRCGA